MRDLTAWQRLIGFVLVWVLGLPLGAVGLVAFCRFMDWAVGAPKPSRAQRSWLCRNGMHDGTTEGACRDCGAPAAPIGPDPRPRDPWEHTR